jgi:hypothetical protein
VRPFRTFIQAFFRTCEWYIAKHYRIYLLYYSAYFYQLSVFTSEPPEQFENLDLQVVSDVEIAYKRAGVLFGSLNLPTGVHAMPLETVLDLIAAINITEQDISWEIGAGELKLAFSLSAAAKGGTVVATDLGN